ncbi:MAG TPA: Nramp family divalent metal transporter [Deltaproteobacteria bacterium]|nr:Nramp family divalent metal transporter [Deltaproteobacteria bacterium]
MLEDRPENKPRTFDSGTISAAEKVLAREKVPWRKRLFPFLGPAFVAAVAYIDPGNFATNIQSGAQLGYTLLWVIIISNLMAMLVQILSAKLGIATGLNLAELCRNHFPAPLVWAMWVTLEIVAIATDLAEFVGAAVGLFLLFHIPLVYAGLLTAVVTFLILGLQRYGFRPLEAIITAMIGIVAVSYLIEIFLVKTEPAQIASSLFIPSFGSRQGVLLATGILGATVMPHVIFLHSALTQGRIIVKDVDKLKRLFRFEIMDVAIAMTIAGVVNAAMLIMAASTFYAQGLREIGTLEEAYRTLSPLLGPAAGKIFAIALIAAGLSSSAVGTMSGQVVMQGFVHFRIPLWTRRLVTVLPSLAVLSLGLDPTRTLVISQVVLSFGLPFAVIPLVLFTANKKIMGPLVNRPFTSFLAGIATLLILALNSYLIYSIAAGGD